MTRTKKAIATPENIAKFQPMAAWNERSPYFKSMPEFLDERMLRVISNEAAAALKAANATPQQYFMLMPVANVFDGYDAVRALDATVLAVMLTGGRLRQQSVRFHVELGPDIWFPVMWTTAQRLMRRGWIVMTEATPDGIFFRANCELDLPAQICAYLESQE